MEPSYLHAYPPTPVRTGEEAFVVWLTVPEAVAHCERQGLPRTAKTIRKWASRSYLHPDQADISVRREDTENGFRWIVERSSLDRKIAEDLAYETRTTPEPVSTGAHQFTPRLVQNKPETEGETPVHPSTPVRTALTEPLTPIEQFLREQLAEKDRQIDKLNAQIERRDEQIMTVLERDRETNLLINGLTNTLSQTLGIEAPNPTRHRPAAAPTPTPTPPPSGEGDNPPSRSPWHTV